MKIYCQGDLPKHRIPVLVDKGTWGPRCPLEAGGGRDRNRYKRRLVANLDAQPLPDIRGKRLLRGACSHKCRGQQYSFHETPYLQIVIWRLRSYVIYSGIGTDYKKTGAKISADISATRLSSRDPVGFPPHLHRWLSIIVYRYYADMYCLKDRQIRK